MDTNNKTVEELNELLYEKMEFEQAEFKQSLVDMEPPETLNHAYEYAIREDSGNPFIGEHFHFFILLKQSDEFGIVYRIQKIMK